MILSTPGLVLHTTPYSESSVIAKVFTRQLGLRSYIIKGVRGRSGRVKQNLLQPLSSLDMVVYDNPKTDLNYVKELSPRHPYNHAITQSHNNAINNALRFFFTEVLYKALREAEPLPALWDYVDDMEAQCNASPHTPILFLLTVARHLGIEPLDNYSHREPLFDLQEGHFVSAPTESTLPLEPSSLLQQYLMSIHTPSHSLIPLLSLQTRRGLIDALIAYFQLHLSGFHDFHSHEILHIILK